MGLGCHATDQTRGVAPRVVTTVSASALTVAIWRNRDTLAYLALISLSDGFVYSRIKAGPAAVADDATRHLVRLL